MSGASPATIVLEASCPTSMRSCSMRERMQSICCRGAATRMHLARERWPPQPPATRRPSPFAPAPPSLAAGCRPALMRRPRRRLPQGRRRHPRRRLMRRCRSLPTLTHRRLRQNHRRRRRTAAGPVAAAGTVRQLQRRLAVDAAARPQPAAVPGSRRCRPSAGLSDVPALPAPAARRRLPCRLRAGAAL